MRYLGEEDMARQLAELDEVMDDWKRYRETVSLRELMENRDTRNMVLYAVLVAIQTAIQTAHHLIVKDYLPKPGTYEETFLILRKAGTLDADLAEKMARLASYRQKLVHSHLQLDLREIYEVLCAEWGTLERYRAKLTQIMRQEN